MPKRLDGKLAAQIRTARKRRGFTDEGLATRAGISRRQLRVIQDGGNTTVLRVIDLAQALGLTEVELGGGVIGRVGRVTSKYVDLSGALRHLKAIEKRLRLAREALSRPT
jgi:transcriptional regulator with XRE-family HTH domain